MQSMSCEKKKIVQESESIKVTFRLLKEVPKLDKDTETRISTNHIVAKSSIRLNIYKSFQKKKQQQQEMLPHSYNFSALSFSFFPLLSFFHFFFVFSFKLFIFYSEKKRNGKDNFAFTSTGFSELKCLSFADDLKCIRTPAPWLDLMRSVISAEYEARFPTGITYIKTNYQLSNLILHIRLMLLCHVIITPSHVSHNNRELVSIELFHASGTSEVMTLAKIELNTSSTSRAMTQFARRWARIMVQRADFGTSFNSVSFKMQIYTAKRIQKVLRKLWKKYINRI